MNRYHARPGWSHRRRLRLLGLATAAAELVVLVGMLAIIIYGIPAAAGR